MDNRYYSDIPMQNALAIITEEVRSQGDSYGWKGEVATPLREELGKRGIVLEEDDMYGPVWIMDPYHTGNPDDIPFEVYKAADEYREGRTGPLTDDEIKAWGGSSFKLGNHKLGEDTIIFNMTSGHDCPCRNKCDVKANCYATADEKLYPNVLPYRRRQTIFWDSTTAEQFVEAMPIPRYFRFSESGDFRNQEDVDKMVEVAEILNARYNIRTYGYTNRDDVDLSELARVAVVNGHGFMINNKTVVKDKPEEGDFVCPGDCRCCNACKEPGRKTIVFTKRKR
jgi:hypothetical protein